MANLNFQAQGTRETRLVADTEPVEESWSTGEVDIIVHALEADGYARHDSDITSISQLSDFLGGHGQYGGRLNHARTGNFLLLIEDISPEVVSELTNHLDIETDVFKHHARERLNGKGIRQRESILHADKLASTLLGRTSTKKDSYSLTWWKLLTYSLAKYTSEMEALMESNADATKVVVPHFSVQISDTQRKVDPSKKQITQVKSGARELLRQWNKTRDEAEGYGNHSRNLDLERTVETVYKLHCNTYRAHQVVSEVKDDMWGSASEERLTYVKASSHGSTFCTDLYLPFLA